MPHKAPHCQWANPSPRPPLLDRDQKVLEGRGGRQLPEASGPKTQMDGRSRCCQGTLPLVLRITGTWPLWAASPGPSPTLLNTWESVWISNQLPWNAPSGSNQLLSIFEPAQEAPNHSLLPVQRRNQVHGRNSPLPSSPLTSSPYTSWPLRPSVCS